MNKVIFFSGTHGSGKTTTLKAVAERLGIPVFNDIADDHRNPCEKDIFRRQAWRIGKYFSDAIHLKDISAQGNGIILVDRCVYDWLAYTRTFKNRGWLSQSDFKKLEGYLACLFDKSLVPKRVVWFDPPFAWSKERILNRWNEEKKKWNEGDFEYLEVLRGEYEKIYGSLADARVLHLTETDITKRVKEISDFIA